MPWHAELRLRFLEKVHPWRSVSTLSVRSLIDFFLPLATVFNNHPPSWYI
jgi:hypothetical protein